MKRTCYCINLRRAANVVSSVYDSYLKPVDITISQFSLLINIERLGTCSVSQLAEQVNLERTTLVRMIKPLTAKGLIEDLSLAGQRNRKLKLTETGEKLLDEAKGYWIEAQREIKRKIGKERVDVLMDILDQLEEMVED